MNQWSVALHQELHYNEKVCELHFAEEDVIKSDDTVMPDGTIFSLPRNKYLLRKSAIPKDILEQECIILEKNVRTFIKIFGFFYDDKYILLIFFFFNQRIL